MKDVRLFDLICIMEWEDVRSSKLMIDLESGAISGKRESLEGCRTVFEKLKRMEPLVSDWTLVFSISKDGSPKVGTKPPSGTTMRVQEGVDIHPVFGIDLRPWAEILGMFIDQQAIDEFDWEDIVAYTLWEMTFYGTSESKRDFELEEMLNSAEGYFWHFFVFISHASEDKNEIVIPLAHELQALGIKVWFDKFEMRWGDSIRRKIDEGLAKCDYGIIVISRNFFKKPWPEYELDGLVAREIAGEKTILPIWHKVNRDEVLAYSPNLADKIAFFTSDYKNDIEGLALKIHDELLYDYNKKNKIND